MVLFHSNRCCVNIAITIGFIFILHSLNGQTFDASDNSFYGVRVVSFKSLSDYDVQITHYNPNSFLFEKGKFSKLYVIINDDNVSLFKSELVMILDKFNEWKQIAIENEVTQFEKQIPVEINSISNMYGCMPSISEVNDEWYSYDELCDLYPLFTVSKDIITGKISYTLELFIRFCRKQGKLTCFVDKCVLNQNDIFNLIDAIDKAVVNGVKKEIDKRNTDALFH